MTFGERKLQTEGFCFFCNVVVVVVFVFVNDAMVKMALCHKIAKKKKGGH